MSGNPCRVLLVSSHLDNVHLVQEAFSELEEDFRRRWLIRVSRVVPVETLGDALDLLAAEVFDTVLLDPHLPDCDGLHSYLRIKAQAPALPVILVVSPEDEDLGQSAIREGAQDYLLNTEIDCAPLIRCLHHAMERSKLEQALNNASIRDPGTGLYSRPGFELLAEQEWKVASRLRVSVAVWLVRLRNGDDTRFLDAANALRHCLPQADLLARFDRVTLAAVALQPPVLESLRSPGGSLKTAVAVNDFAAGDTASFRESLARVEQSLCENGPSSGSSSTATECQPTV